MMIPTVSELLFAAQAEVDRLQAYMAQGHAADLSSLGPKLAALTQNLPGLPKDEGQKLVARLNALEKSLGTLQIAFEQQKAGAEAGLSEIATRLQAGTAYAKSIAARTKDPADGE